MAAVDAEVALQRPAFEVIQGRAQNARFGDVHDELRSGALVECLQDYWSDEIELYACFASRGHMPGRVRAFTAFLVDQLSAASRPGTFA